MRVCARMGCQEPATATAAVKYGDRVVCIWELVPERDPRFVDLCATHIERVSPMLGWTLVDERGGDRGQRVAEPVRLPVQEARSLSA